MVDNDKAGHLLLALQNGDAEAFTAIYKAYWYDMFLVAYRKLRNKEAAEEIVQDIFLRLWRERDSLRVQNLNYYLFAAVRYEVIDHIRTQGPTVEYLDYYELSNGIQDAGTENQLALDDLLRVIDECLHILPEKTREIFRLHKLEYWPIARIAARFGLSEKAVEYHLTKSVRLVRTHLKEVMVLLLATSGLL
ncbi:DNA-directed RNA polymerase sigma-70 factor [Dyadobacter beijingensis]|uniref:DNA-directed RNA polymerase sigma-70 factor n=1 Tax=Dyadobacter beijingensis TaxID=365489 RepID=A0ABQ2IH12_9BACT|nr:sigma-70 family RNA polymerase sigma factor [Dyadobacter beijingensis]GGN08180.1 DNA-directed RNA polymerase sigma-70 factor [Dyadobacter beijingensis]